jgi:hypothetical protein
MPITLGQPAGTATPVVKRTAIGQTFIGALVNKEQRGILKDDKPVLNTRGKPSQELVLTLIALPGTTAPAGIGDSVGVPEPGDIVRMIIRGLSFKQWIDIHRDMPEQVGDIVTQITDSAQVYDANGKAEGRQLTTQAEVENVPRTKTLGIYGTITAERPDARHADWVTKAESEYLAMKATPLTTDDEDFEPPF